MSDEEDIIGIIDGLVETLPIPASVKRKLDTVKAKIMENGGVGNITDELQELKGEMKRLTDALEKISNLDQTLIDFNKNVEVLILVGNNLNETGKVFNKNVKVIKKRMKTMNKNIEIMHNDIEGLREIVAKFGSE